jgi:predicted negative regulator of RcsB-dependent stress response
MNDKIDIELAEDEDLARAKAWWKENGSSIIGGIVIGTILVFGYNFWQSYQQEHAREVAQLYVEYSRAGEDSGTLDSLLEADDSVAYSQLARLKAAKVATDAGEFETAEQLFISVLDSKTDSGILAITSLRLAMIYLANDKPDEALASLEKYSNSNLPLMQARVEELKGDIYMQRGDIEKARSHFETSVGLLTELRQPLQLIQLKLDNL